ncbi:acyltransferase family protein [Mucilaginibacter sp.]|uniref:acyltransferase family protein n=1 Tax=Mucilaginibacter sp. TaxID=1882438 RepID=UPI0035BC7AF7
MVHHLKKVDLARGIAILLIFLFHCHLILFGQLGQSAFSISTGEKKIGWSEFLINYSPIAFGWVGVPLFFLTSGFLIHLGYLKEGKKFNLKTFFSKRFWRIFPPYWFSFVVFILAGHIFQRHSTSLNYTDILLHLLTLHNVSDRYIYSVNPAYWSLAAEVQLYLIYPVFLLIRRWTGIRNCFLLLLLLSAMLTFLGVYFNNFGTLYVYSKNTLGLWFIWAAGAWYAEVIYLPGKILVPKYALPFFLLACFILLVSSLFRTANYFAFFVATVACLIFFDALLHDKWFSENQLLSKLFMVTGLSSYSFYLIHQPYLKLLLNLCGAQSGNRLRVLSVIPAFLITLVVAYLLYKLIELPPVRLGRCSEISGCPVRLNMSGYK